MFPFKTGWTAQGSHVLLYGQVKEQKPVCCGAGGPRQWLHHTRDIRPGAAVLEWIWGCIHTLRPGLAQRVHRGWVSNCGNCVTNSTAGGSLTPSLQENGTGATTPEGAGSDARSQRSGGKMEQCADRGRLLQRPGHPLLWRGGWWQTDFQYLSILWLCHWVHPWSPESATEWVWRTF